MESQSRFWSRTKYAFWAAFVVRVAYMTLAHTYRVRPFPDHFDYGWEMGRIARALVTGYGFADPFKGHTGPTAWVGPLYPLLMAGVFKLTGVYTAASAWILLALNSLFSALTVFPIAAIAGRCFGRGERIGQWAIWLWALYPAAMQFAVRWIWETSLSTLLFTCTFALALRMRGRAPERPGRFAMRDWVLFGLLWGAIALANPALVVFLPCAGLWALMGRGPVLARGLAGALVSAAVFLAMLAPWMARNARVFHHFVPLRSNFGAELYLGNGPGATGLLMEYEHPEKDPQQLRLYRQMGEYSYAKMRGEMAKRVIAADPGLFARNTLKRLYFFWFGVPSASGNWATRFFRSLNYGFLSTTGILGMLLALRRRVYGAWLFFFAFLSVPAVFYFVTVHARFRHPLEPLIAVLGVFLFQSGSR
ncbi:MAG TPA: hypothetical protein VF126_00370 [Acidobacteriaceae bacterium]